MTDDALQQRQRRAALNQSLFRKMNEGINQLPEGSAFTEYACECARATCDARVPLTADEYEEVRRNPTHFAVAPGHVQPEAERVVAATDRYQVVEKFGVAAEISEKLDPRGAQRPGLTT